MIGYSETNMFKEHIELIDACGICDRCKKINTGRKWCSTCDPGRFLSLGESSGNKEIDDFICKAQRKTKHYDDNLEWIPFSKFKDIKPIGEGGFAKIYSATWLDKPKLRDNTIVALKKLKGSTEDFINEIKIHNKCSFSNSYITQFYGITKEPKTGDFMMVLEYAAEGNLREYLKINSSLKWCEKLELLHNIIDNLNCIHSNKYMHKDLHSGNILHFHYYAKITDLGLAQLIHNSNSNVCGVLPYIAPEVLDGKPYTFASDIYSLGIVMVEMSTGNPPYGSVPHNEMLALAICNGLRPRVAEDTPKYYIDLVNQCLDANPEKRPTVKIILEKIKNWRFLNIEDEKRSDVNNIGLQKSSLETTIHSEAIYTSRYMNFTNLPKPRNFKGIQVENLEVSDSQLIKLCISEEV